MKIKLLTIILFMVFMVAPVFAQSKNKAAQNQNKADNINPVPTLISEKKGMGEEKKAENMEKSKVLREEAKNKKAKASQLKSEVASEHRSVVANFVQGLLDVADRQALGGIGEKVREIARQQNDSEDKVAPLMDKVKNKNKVRKFFFGTDFKKTKEIRKEMLESKNRIKELEKAKDEIVNPEDKQKIDEEISNLKSSIASVLSEIQTEENIFSLFGWVKKIFVK